MGQTINSFKKEIEQLQDSNKNETIEQFTRIQQTLATKLETKTNEMRAAATKDESFPVAAVVNKLEKYLISAVKNASVEEIERCINEMFRTQFLGGFVNLATADINELLGNSSAGEKEKMATHVVFANSSFLRVDYFLCKYTLSSNGFKDKFKNAVCYAVQVGVLDLEKADLDLVKQELDKTLTTVNLQGQDTEQTQKLHQEVACVTDFYRVITRLQIVFGSELDKSKLAWENILSYLLVDSCQNRQSPTEEGIRQLRKWQTRKPRLQDPEPFAEMEFRVGKHRSNVERRWRDPMPVPYKIEDKKEREKHKVKEKRRRQRDRDKKVAWNVDGE